MIAWLISFLASPKTHASSGAPMEPVCCRWARRTLPWASSSVRGLCWIFTSSLRGRRRGSVARRITRTNSRCQEVCVVGIVCRGGQPCLNCAHQPSTGRAELGTPSDIAFTMVDGDFQAFQGVWRMQRCGGDGCCLSYALFVRPQVWLPVRLIQVWGRCAYAMRGTQCASPAGADQGGGGEQLMCCERVCRIDAQCCIVR